MRYCESGLRCRDHSSGLRAREPLCCVNIFFEVYLLVQFCRTLSPRESNEGKAPCAHCYKMQPLTAEGKRNAWVAACVVGTLLVLACASPATRSTGSYHAAEHAVMLSNGGSRAQGKSAPAPVPAPLESTIDAASPAREPHAEHRAEPRALEHGRHGAEAAAAAAAAGLALLATARRKLASAARAEDALTRLLLANAAAAACEHASDLLRALSSSAASSAAGVRAPATLSAPHDPLAASIAAVRAEAVATQGAALAQLQT